MKPPINAYNSELFVNPLSITSNILKRKRYPDDSNVKSDFHDYECMKTKESVSSVDDHEIEDKASSESQHTVRLVDMNMETPEIALKVK